MIGWVECVFLFGGRSGGNGLVLRSELGTAGVQFRARDAKGRSVSRKCRSKRLKLVASFTLSQVSSVCLSSRFIWPLGCGNPPVMLCLMLAAELLRVPPQTGLVAGGYVELFIGLARRGRLPIRAAWFLWIRCPTRNCPLSRGGLRVHGNNQQGEESLRCAIRTRASHVTVSQEIHRLDLGISFHPARPRRARASFHAHSTPQPSFSLMSSAGPTQR
jgi:hypothetical protein